MDGALYGQYQHNIDAKGRVFMPAKFRDVLGEVFYVMPGIEMCLNVYSKETWQVMQEKINAIPLSKRGDLRVFMANICECVPDKQGRILLPGKLREYASLEQDAVIIGQGDHVEIWPNEPYSTEEKENLSPAYIKHSLDVLGI
ncbi:MAG: division/cell wall cluster transcriptional repressor MraZ [Oscillospiraceae bacterium]|nr:division/cell wall cluster transcriptional repressor MraZ [Oscillospiraceae bacterium]